MNTSLRFCNIFVALILTGSAWAANPPDNTFVIGQSKQALGTVTELIEINPSTNHARIVGAGSLTQPVTSSAILPGDPAKGVEPFALVITQPGGYAYSIDSKGIHNRGSNFNAVHALSPTEVMFVTDRNELTVVEGQGKFLMQVPNFNMTPARIGYVFGVEHLGGDNFIFVSATNLVSATVDLARGKLTVQDNLGLANTQTRIDGRMMEFMGLKQIVANQFCVWAHAVMRDPSAPNSKGSSWLVFLSNQNGKLNIVFGHEVGSSDIQLLDIDPMTNDLLLRNGKHYERRTRSMTSGQWPFYESTTAFEIATLASKVPGSKSLIVGSKIKVDVPRKGRTWLMRGAQAIQSPQPDVVAQPDASKPLQPGRTKEDFRKLFEREARLSGSRPVPKISERAENFKNRVNSSSYAYLQLEFKHIPSQALTQFGLRRWENQKGDGLLEVIPGQEDKLINVDEVFELLAKSECTRLLKE